jgi:hypothetical protein
MRIERERGLLLTVPLTPRASTGEVTPQFIGTIPASQNAPNQGWSLPRAGGSIVAMLGELIRSVFLLPLFCVCTGLHTQVELLSDASWWLLCA